MTRYDYDLFVIGAGSGGVRAARLAALTGARVAIAEQDRVGGTCVIRGCIPKKFMVYASGFAHDFETAEGYGWKLGETRFDWPAFLAAKDAEIARLSGVYVSNLANAGADLMHGRAVLADPHTVEIEGRRITAEKMLVAVGGTPTLPEVPGVELAITSNEAFHLEALPRRILIVGGGYIAVEFAGIFHGLGVETTLAYRGPNILRGFDDDVRAHLAAELERQGVKVLLACQHERLEKAHGGILSSVTTGHKLQTDLVLFATGRAPNTRNLGLEEAGVKLTERGAVAVDEYSRSSVDNIWAVGDVTDRINLTPVAIREGQAFAQTEFEGAPTRFDHATVASAVFSQPPIGAVGLTEAQARHGGRKIDVYRSVFRPMKVTLFGGQERMMVKLVVERDSGKVLGCHIVGPDAPEMIQMAAIAVKLGVTKAQWDDTCAVHPTAAEELVTMREPHAPVELSAA